MLLPQPPYTQIDLQGVVEELVHLGDAARDAEVDRPVADLDDEAANDVSVHLGGSLASVSFPSVMAAEGTYLVSDLERLASADVLRLGDGILQPAEGLGIQLLKPTSVNVPQHDPLPIRIPSQPGHPQPGSTPTYLSAGDNHLNLALRRRDQDAELLAHALEQPEPVVLRQRGEEVPDRLAAGAGLLRQLLDHGALVLGRQRRRREDALELRVAGEEGLQGREGLGRGVEGRGLAGRGVLRWTSLAPSRAGGRSQLSSIGGFMAGRE